MAGRKPDYKLMAKDATIDKWIKVGAAWVNENGSVSIDLDPFVVLRGQDHLSLALYPNDDKK